LSPGAKEESDGPPFEWSGITGSAASARSCSSREGGKRRHSEKGGETKEKGNLTVKKKKKKPGKGERPLPAGELKRRFHAG